MQFDQLKRREFITLLGGAAAWPLAARAMPGHCSSLSEAGFLTSAVARGPKKSRSTDGPTPSARDTRFLGVDRCE
jgi:hypothetical protein